METTEEQPSATDREAETGTEREAAARAGAAGADEHGPGDQARDAGDADTGTDAADAGDDADDDADELLAPPRWTPEPEGPRRTVGVGSGASAVVAAGLGLASLTGTWLGTLFKEREQLIGQIKSSGKPAAVQIGADYGTPWHAYALVNGAFALLAVLAAVAVLLFTSSWLAVARPAPWVRAVAWAGLALGVIGLLVSGAMFFDIFTSLPAAPASTG